MTQEATPPTTTTTYRGNCHCGNFIYTLTIPEITSLSSCDCSFCSKKGILWTVTTHPDDQFKIIKGDEQKDLAVYQFAGKALLHKFCKTCGSALFVRWPTGPSGRQLLVNARCIQNLDPWEIPSKTFPGSTIGEPFKPSKFDGPEPTASDLKDPQTYHGSCHCGDVKLAFKTEPITEHTLVMECNCSICRRNGYIWAYPKLDQVVITGSDSLTSYSHGRRVFAKTFCRRCGVAVQNVARDLSSEELAELPEGFVNFYTMAKTIQPVNLRLLDGFDFLSLNPKKSRGWESMGPQYVNP